MTQKLIALGLDFNSQHPYGRSKACVIPVPGHLAPSSGLNGHCKPVLHIHAGKTPGTYKTILILMKET